MPMSPFAKTTTLLPLIFTLIVSASGCVGLADLDHQLNSPTAVATPHHGGAVPGVPPAVVPAVAPEPMTLPRFLGLDVVARRCYLAKSIVHERAGQFIPVLKPTPLPVPLNHPSNADHPSPAVAAAHNVQKAKAAKAAKVAAVKVLAGESCHDNPEIEAGLLAALDDTSPEVRIAAAEAVLRSTRSCDDGCGRCCRPAIVKKLGEIAYAKNDDLCFVEPSSQARRVARLAIEACVSHCGCGTTGCDDYYPAMEQPLHPEEAPSPEIIEEILGVNPIP